MFIQHEGQFETSQTIHQRYQAKTPLWEKEMIIILTAKKRELIS